MTVRLIATLTFTLSACTQSQAPTLQECRQLFPQLPTAVSVPEVEAEDESPIQELRKISSANREARFNHALDMLRDAAKRGVTSHSLETDLTGYKELKPKFEQLGFRVKGNESCENEDEIVILFPDHDLCHIIVSWDYEGPKENE